MGYTHYFPRLRAISDAEWGAITKDVRLLLGNLPAHSLSAGGYYSDAPLRLALEEGEPEPPLVDDRYIIFNGTGGDDLGHETFYIDRESADEFGRNRPDIPFGFDFCKTARKPYDLAVCAVLAVMHDRAPGGWRIGSDGDLSDWKPALDWAAKVLGRILADPCRDRKSA